MPSAAPSLQGDPDEPTCSGTTSRAAPLPTDRAVRQLAERPDDGAVPADLRAPDFQRTCTGNGSRTRTLSTARKSRASRSRCCRNVASGKHPCARRTRGVAGNRRRLEHAGGFSQAVGPGRRRRPFAKREGCHLMVSRAQAANGQSWRPLGMTSARGRRTARARRPARRYERQPDACSYQYFRSSTTQARARPYNPAPLRRGKGRHAKTIPPQNESERGPSCIKRPRPAPLGLRRAQVKGI